MVDLDNDNHTQNSWSNTAEHLTIPDISNNVMPETLVTSATTKGSHSSNNPGLHQSKEVSDGQLGIGERAVSAAGAAFLSAILMNPLDVVKTRLQAQAAGVAYSHPLSNLTSRMAFFGPTMMFADLRCSPSCTRAGVQGTVSICPPDCFHYKGTLDVFYKIVRQEGMARLWRGTNAALALAVPTVGIYLPCYDILRNQLEEFTSKNAPSLAPKLTLFIPGVASSMARALACVSCYPIELAKTRMQAFKEINNGRKPPGVWKTLFEVISNVKSTNNTQSWQNYRVLWTGVGAQLSRDVPFSAICWSTFEPVKRGLLNLSGDKNNIVSILGANFAAGFVSGSIAAGATCPLDVAKTRRQIEKDPIRALRMTTRQTLMEVWRDGGLRGLFYWSGATCRACRPLHSE